MRDGGPDELGGRRHEREMLALASLEVAGKDEKRKDEGPDENRVAAQPGGQLFRCSVGLLTH